MQILLAIVSCILIIAVFLSHVKRDFWVYKILEYPRLQKLVLLVVVLIIWVFQWPYDSLFYKLVVGALIISVVYVIYKIWPYTILSKKEMLKALHNDPANQLKVFTANVYQDNHQYDNMLNQIRETDPDLIFLLETDEGWINHMKQLEKDYPYQLSAPLDNTYGLQFYSRLALSESSVNYLVKDDIPSISGIIELKSGEKIQLFGLHPEPPVPGESAYSTAKDKELMIVALKVRECKLPAIVFGDLNDVAWSHTTELFRKTSGMLDPRRGRGYYNTFSAHSWFIRFPLDYIFCTKEFRLIEMKRLPKNGSDHFAMFTFISFEKSVKEGQEIPEADKEELKEAKEIAHQPVKE